MHSAGSSRRKERSEDTMESSAENGRRRKEATMDATKR